MNLLDENIPLEQRDLLRACLPKASCATSRPLVWATATGQVLPPTCIPTEISTSNHQSKWRFLVRCRYSKGVSNRAKDQMPQRFCRAKLQESSSFRL